MMLQDWLNFCGFPEEERAQAALGISRLEEALPRSANIDSASNWEVLEAAATMLSRIKSRWAQKILYIWENYYDFLDENPEAQGCDLSWFTAGEPLGSWPTEPDYPLTYQELFEDFVVSEWFGAQRTRLNVRSILRTLVRLFEQINPRRNKVDDLISMSRAAWNQLEGSAQLDFTPATASLYLSIYRDLFRYIVSQGWRDGLPFEESERGTGRPLSGDQAISEFWGALIETSRDLNEAYTVDQIIDIEESADPTMKAEAIRDWARPGPYIPTINNLPNCSYW